MKTFSEALQDGFKHITEITDPQTLKALRQEGIKVDEEGYYSFFFGEHKEYEWRVEPVGDFGHYLFALYKNSILLTHKLPIWIK